jgi:polyisoprenoid-binding protein YceI
MANAYNPRQRHVPFASSILKIAALYISLAFAIAAEHPILVYEIDPSHSQVAFTLPSTFHTVNGTFRIESGSITVDAENGKATGQVVVDATSGDSGNDRRDRRMHRQILESQRYPKIVFAPSKVSGRLPQQGDAKIEIAGLFTIHGASHPITAPVLVHSKAGRFKETTDFVIPYVDWGMKNPSNLFLKVKDNVQIHLELNGRVVHQ